MPKVKLNGSATPTPPPVVNVPVLDAERPKPDEFLADGHPNPAAFNVWDYMQALTPDQWTEHKLYLYRTIPKSERRANEPGYLKTFTMALTREELQTTCGGRRFLLILNRRVGGRDKKVKEESININADPIPQPGEILLVETNTSANGSASAAETNARLIEDVIQQRDRAQAEGKSFDVRQYIGDMLELQSTVLMGAAKTAAGMNGNNGGNSLTDKLIMLVAPKIIEQMMGDPVAKLASTIELVKALKGDDAPPPVATSSPWEAAVVAAINQFPAALDRLVTVSENWVIASGKQPAQPAGASSTSANTSARPPVYATGEPIQQPAARQPDAVSMPAASAVPPDFEHAADAESPEPPLIADRRAVNAGIVRILVSGAHGSNAACFAETANAEYCYELVDMFRTNPASLLAIPEFAEVVKDEAMKAKLPQFLQDFVSPFPEAEKTTPAAA